MGMEDYFDFERKEPGLPRQPAAGPDILSNASFNGAAISLTADPANLRQSDGMGGFKGFEILVGDDREGK